MVNYRRDRTFGGTYFFTLALENRQSNILTRYIKQLGQSFRQAQRNHFFILDAIVVLPDHLHMVMTLPEYDADYSLRWRQIKTYFLQAVLKEGEYIAKNHRNQYGLWQKRFWEHRIRDESNKNIYIDYIHYNPVKHGWVEQVQDWPYSSFHRYVQKGVIEKNWGGTVSSLWFGE